MSNGGYDDDVVTLDVGGTTFRTTYSTLGIDLYSNPSGEGYFQAAYNSSENSNRHGPRSGSVERPMFIDRSPELFAVILHYLRYDTFVFPCDNETFRTAVFDEMTYFGMSVPCNLVTANWHRAQLKRKERDEQLDGKDLGSAFFRPIFAQLLRPERMKFTPEEGSPIRYELLVTPSLESTCAQLATVAEPWPNMKIALGFALKTNECFADDAVYKELQRVSQLRATTGFGPVAPDLQLLSSMARKWCPDVHGTLSIEVKALHVSQRFPSQEVAVQVVSTVRDLSYVPVFEFKFS